MNIPIIQAVASFQDACFYIKHKHHLAPNAAAAKKRIAKALSLPENISYSVYAFELGHELMINGKRELVMSTKKRYNFGARVKGDYVEFYVKK